MVTESRGGQVTKPPNAVKGVDVGSLTQQRLLECSPPPHLGLDLCEGWLPTYLGILNFDLGE